MALAPVAVVFVVAPSITCFFFDSLKESNLQLKLENVADDEEKRGTEDETKAVLVPFNSHSLHSQSRL